MKVPALGRRLTGPALALALGVSVSIVGCGKKEESAPAAAPGAPPAGAPVATQSTAMQQPAPQTWSPEALEELLAPIALYPDTVLAQVLMASTNPQEVLDAGNWLLQNQNLSGKALDDAAAKVGFTPPIRALIQFPETVDMMCMQLEWTTELGQAYVADQPGVLDAVQRLRKQAKDVGNLQSSEQMKVETEMQGGEEIVKLEPARPEVVYVPTYDPQAVYAPAPQAAAAPAPAATTTTTATTEEKGHSTGSLVATGLLAFGAGMLVNEIFDDDEDDYYHHHDDYWYGGGMPYYPPYPYRPAYGNGYYPANGYNRPPNYQHGFNNNNVVVINNGQNKYWSDRDNRRNQYQKSGTYQARSPITTARPNRPELQELNQRQPRPMPADVKRPAPDATRDSWRDQGGYAGASKGGYNKAATARPAAGTGAAGSAARQPPKVQGSYAGATPERMKAQQKAGQRPTPTTAAGKQPAREIQPKPSQQRPSGDRGYQKPADARPETRPAPSTKPQQMNRPAPSQDRGSAVSGANRGSADRAASQRGKQSKPQGARSKGGGQGKKQGR